MKTIDECYNWVNKQMKLDQEQIYAVEQEIEEIRIKIINLEYNEDEKEEELKRRRMHYEDLRTLLGRERERILKQVIPKRHTLRGSAQVFPVAIEIRFHEGRK